MIFFDFLFQIFGSQIHTWKKNAMGRKKNQNVKNIPILGLKYPKWWEDSKYDLKIQIG